MHSEQSGLGAIVPWQALLNAELSAFTQPLGGSLRPRRAAHERLGARRAPPAHGDGHRPGLPWKLTTICWFMQRTRRQNHVAEAEAQERFWRQCQAGSAADPCYPHMLIMLTGGGFR